MTNYEWHQPDTDVYTTTSGEWAAELHPKLREHSVDMARSPRPFFHPHGVIHVKADDLFVLYTSDSPDSPYGKFPTLWQAKAAVDEAFRQ